MRAVGAAIFAAALATGLSGCKGPQPGGVVQGPVSRGAAPEYASVAVAYNARVDPLVRLWARMVVRLKFIDAEGKPREEQIDGIVQFVRPSKALVTFLKFSQLFAMLGSDEDRYWWIELEGQKRAFVGRHDRATPERIARAGLRVHPLDLMELLGLTPLPGESASATTAWSDDGKWIVVTVPGRDGRRRLLIDPDSHEPSRIEIVGESGKVLAVSNLGAFQVVALKGAGPSAARSRVPTKVTVEADEGATRIIMDVSEPQDDPARFRPFAFNFEKLVEMNGVPGVERVDE